MKLEISKIVGSLNGSSWSQVHSFRPESAKLDSHGQLLAAVSFKVKTEIDISSFGAEIIQRLQEIYYSHAADSVLKKLNQTIETLAAEFLDQVELEIVALVVWHDFLYAAKNAAGQVWLKRGDDLVTLFSGDGLAAISGRLETDDVVLAATGQFRRLVPEGSLLPALSQDSAAAASESLSAPVHGHEDNSRTAAIIIKTGSGDVKPVPHPETALAPAVHTHSRSAFFIRFRSWLDRAVSRLKRVKKPEIFLGQRVDWKRRSTLTVAAVLLAVFIVSLFLAGRKRQEETREQAYRSVREEVNYKLAEANNLQSLNPLRARSLLQESQARIKDYREQEKNPRPEILDLEQQVAQALEQAQRQYAADASEWYDFDLIRDGFKGESWDLSETELLVWDETGKTAARLNLVNRAAAVIVDGLAVGLPRTAGYTGDRGFLAGSDRMAVVDTDKESQLGEVEADGWKNIVRARGFGSNLYLLDAAANSQIWKYLGTDEGLSGKKSYLEGESYDLASAADMAIDGSVWVLFSDGTIVKYTRGRKDAFTVIGLDQPLADAVRIFTGPEAEHLYVLDRANTRVVVLDKTGEYASQYAWPGIAGVKDFVVSEELGKIFFLTGEKVFTIDLK